MAITLKSQVEIKKMRLAGKILNSILKKIVGEVAPGVSTESLDKLAEKLIKKKGAFPAFKGFKDYPNSLCVSVNEEVVHGIPKQRKLREGDIVGLDLGLKYRGYFADKTITVGVGKISKEAKKLIWATREALKRAILAAKPGKTTGGIGFVINKTARENNFFAVKDLFGHGIGRQLHEEPAIPNFGEKGDGVVLKEGMTFAIEPIINIGTEKIRIKKDGWTAVSADGSLSAHFEDTVAITKKDAEVLTI